MKTITFINNYEHNNNNINNNNNNNNNNQFFLMLLVLVGTSASDVHFQAYLLEGLCRWNADRATAAVTSSTPSDTKTYSGLLCQTVNALSESVLGRKLKPGFQQIGKYSGN